MSNVVRLRRSTAAIILVVIFGLLAILAVGYNDLRRLQDFDARRNYDVCIGVNRQLHLTVDRLVMNASLERKKEILDVVDQGATDCEVYKLAP